MSSAGHVFDMISRLKYNRDQLKKRQDHRKHLNTLQQSHVSRKTGIKTKTFSKEQIKKVKFKIRETAKKRERAAWIKIFIVSLFLVVAIGYSLYYLIVN